MSLCIAGHFVALPPTPAPAPYEKAAIKPWRDMHYGPSVRVVSRLIVGKRYIFKLQCGHTKSGSNNVRDEVRCLECLR